MELFPLCTVLAKCGFSIEGWKVKRFSMENELAKCALNKLNKSYFLLLILFLNKNCMIGKVSLFW